MTLGRTRRLYNVDGITPPPPPPPPHPPFVLWFMLLFHVLSRICGICNTSKWGNGPNLSQSCLGLIRSQRAGGGGVFKMAKASHIFSPMIFSFFPPQNLREKTKPQTSGDHRDCYPDVAEEIRGRWSSAAVRDKSSKEFALNRPHSGVGRRSQSQSAAQLKSSPAVSFSLRGSSCLISADICRHVRFHFNRFDL